MKSGGSIFIVVLLIVSTAAAQATQPGQDSSSPVRTILRPIQTGDIPSQPRGERVSVREIYAGAIRARNDIKTLRYRIRYDEDVVNPLDGETHTRRGWEVRFQGTFDCFLIDTLGTTRMSRTGEADGGTGKRFFSNPDFMIHWFKPTLNPLKVWYGHERWKDDALARRAAGTTLHILHRWGFGTVQTLSGRIEDVVPKESLAWYYIGSEGGRRRYELWSVAGERPTMGARIEIDVASGLIAGYQAFDPAGLEVAVEQTCEFQQVSDQHDPAKTHWVPSRITTRSMKFGQPVHALLGTVDQVAINLAWDCDGAAEMIRNELPENPNLKWFEQGLDGKTIVFGRRDGKWVDLEIPEASSGSALARPEHLNEVPTGWTLVGGTPPPEAPRKLSGLLLLAAGLALVFLGSFLLRRFHSRKRGMR